MQDPATKFRTNKSFYTHGVPNFDHDFRSRKHARNYSFPERGLYSPHWWKPSPIKSPLEHHGNGHKSPGHLNHHGNGHNSPSHLNGHGHEHKNGHQSPESRIEAIAEGQRKLMEMASEMPESSHELSMKDIVEVSTASPDHGTADEKYLLDMQRNMDENTRKNNGSQKKVHVERSSSVENGGGHLLKMAFPFSVGSKKKTKKNVHPSSSNDGSIGRDSPRALLDDKDWGKLRSGESDYGGSIRHSASKSSSDSANSHVSHIRSHNEAGCWSFFCTGERHGHRGRGNYDSNKDCP